MWESAKFLRNSGILAVVAGVLMFAAPARADAISDAVLNLNFVPTWAAQYLSSNISPTTINLFSPGNTTLTITDTNSPFITDTTDTDHAGDFALTIHFAGGVATTGSLQEDADINDDGNVVTVFSSTTLRAFGPIANTAGEYYYFAFQNGADPNNLIGGIITGGDVKTLAISVPEPSSMFVLGAMGMVFGTGRISRRFRRAAV